MLPSFDQIVGFIFSIQVDTAGWLQRAGQEKGPGSLSVMQSRKSLMRAHVIALVLDAEEVWILTLFLSTSLYLTLNIFFVIFRMQLKTIVFIDQKLFISNQETVVNQEIREVATNDVYLY